MKMIGLLGGTSRHSTVQYYQYINEQVNEHFGDNTNSPLMLYNLNQSLIHNYQESGDWCTIAELLVDGATRLQNGGAEALIICANTPHKVYDNVAAQIEVPILHIVDVTASVVKGRELSKVGFIGTRFTMAEDFLVTRFAENGLAVR